MVVSSEGLVVVTWWSKSLQSVLQWIASNSHRAAIDGATPQETERETKTKAELTNSQAIKLGDSKIFQSHSIFHYPK
ncbi:hypothetical protein CRG98_050162, partial [Punica granatum]